MADARVTQAVVELLTQQNVSGRVTQAVLEFISTLGIICNNPAAGVVGRPYSHTFIAGSGDPPYTFSVLAGALPGGLLLSAGGVLSGTPNQAGVFTPTIQVTDSFGATASVTCTIDIAPQPIALSGSGGFRPSSCGCSPQALQAAAIRRARRRRNSWPYSNVLPLPETIPINQIQILAAPAVGSLGVVLPFRVPTGFRFFLQGVIQDYAGAAIAPGDALWTIDVNTPVGVFNVQALPVQGLISVPVPLGSVASGEVWWFERAYEFLALDLIQSKVFNVNLGGGVFTSGFIGYLEALTT